MFKKVLPAICALFLAAAACNLPGATPVPTVEPETIFTMAALTVDAALASTPAGTPVLPAATATSPAPPQPGPTFALSPSAPSPTHTYLPCNLATFVADVTYPDDTQVTANASFTKTWRLKNVGTCSWSAGYQVVFESGDQMGGPPAQALTGGMVIPGQTVDISVNLTAPSTPGTYRGNWRLREPGGVLFGLTTGNPFWVQIKVVSAGNVLVPNWPTIRKGDQGSIVSALQYLLNSYGSSLSVDGVFGNNTFGAVKDFQQQEGLDVDGIVGQRTWTRLVKGRQVSSGSSGDAVRAVQLLLTSKYGYNLATDGVFGARTREAVVDFQTKKGLSADGIVGPQTWQALIAY